MAYEEIHGEGSAEYTKNPAWKPDIKGTQGTIGVDEERDSEIFIGKSIEGTVKALKVMKNKAGDLNDLLVLENVTLASGNTTTVDVWCVRAILKDKVLSADLVPGDKVKLQFLGKPKGKNYFDYKMWVDRA